MNKNEFFMHKNVYSALGLADLCDIVGGGVRRRREKSRRTKKKGPALEKAGVTWIFSHDYGHHVPVVWVHLYPDPDCGVWGCGK